MSKIICDICGTSYADTATQCPICGCVRPAQTQPVPENDAASGGYTYVKGGRFSKSNVKKRNASEKKPVNKNEDNKKVAIVLIIAIILIGIVVLGVILWASGVFDAFKPGDGVPETTPVTTEPTTPPDLSCQGLVLVNVNYKLEQIGDVVLIDCRKVPENSTDSITFFSENTEVATVDDKGKVTAVQNGTTNIVISCGNVTETCEIVVGDGIFPVEFVLKETTVVLKSIGETVVIYDGPIPVDKIKWTSDNEFIASVDGGVVTAVASGPATITATYMGKSATCEVLCDIEHSGNSGGITEDGDGIGEDGGNSTQSGNLLIYTQYGLLAANDASINVNDTLSLYLGDSSGKRINCTWTCADNIESISITGNVVKGLKSSNKNPIPVTTVYEGKTYTCVIRVN